ncbi:E3 ubiquitin-protein ligase RNF180 isoform X4 [Notolabrus celidotus]|uniref:E3 ubiquitin-protein ligase RNF180 isoform X4 n=1 Tax=Notolabrus celidotus TaxID=1203425 RepID=UPI0014906440|nr:E3 ubiquitin-protein ligase RNF180 isoform X4 [Notolabrus celidotus]
MLRCRKCRKGIIDSTCLSMRVEDTDESSAAACSIWHVNIDTLPEWILTSVNQAQWTVGKLNCQHCSARLGGFNFINRIDCPCGLDATVHLNKSRVDRDHRNCVLIVQPRRTRPERGQTGLMTDSSQSREQRPESSRTALDGLQQKCVAVMSSSSPAVSSHPPSGSENNQSFSFSPLSCISHRRRCSVDEDVAIRSSCFCPAGPLHKSALEMRSAETDESTRSSVAYPVSQQFDSDGEASVNTVTCHSLVSGRTWSPLDQQLLQSVEDVQSSPETTDVHEEVSDLALFLRGRSISDSVAEHDQEEMPQAFPTSLGSNRLSKREKNRLKSLRRKQRRRERWLHNQLEQEQCWTARRRKEKASPAPCVWTSTTARTAVSPAVTSSVSRVSARSPRTDRQTRRARSAARSSHRPPSVKSSTKQPKPSSRKFTTPGSRLSRMLRVPNGRCPAVANASGPFGHLILCSDRELYEL